MYTNTALLDMIAKQRNELGRSQSRCYGLEHELSAKQRGLKFLWNDDKKCIYFTGIQSSEVLMELYNYLEPSLDKPYCRLTKDQMFVMTLTKLRLNTPFQSLAYDYDVSASPVSKYYHRTLFIMYQSLKYALEPTPKENLARHVPQIFKAVYGRRRVYILDYFEIRYQTPEDLTAAASQYSSYKKSKTV